MFFLLVFLFRGIVKDKKEIKNKFYERHFFYDFFLSFTVFWVVFVLFEDNFESILIIELMKILF